MEVTPDSSAIGEFYAALKGTVVVLLGVVVSIIGYFAKRTSDRLDVLQATTVTRDEFNRILDQMREDRAAQHNEGRETMARIEEKIDANAERSHKTRHDINDTVHALSAQVAVIAQEVKRVIDSRHNRGS
jgi:Tfp pilus assembly protein PilO